MVWEHSSRRTKEAKMEATSVKYTYEAKALSINQWRGLHWTKCAKIRKEWREAFYYMFLQNPHKFTSGKVDVVVHHEIKRNWQDPAACIECFKAGLDGLVDGGMIPDDNPHYVNSVKFMSPIKTGRDALTIEIVLAPLEET